MKKLAFFYRSKVGLLVLALALISSIITVNIFAAGINHANKETVQTNSNSNKQKKIKKVVRQTMKQSKHTPVSEGPWGGSGIRLTVGSKTTTIEYDCAEGEITEILAVDQNGNFDAQGFHSPQRGGPLRENAPDNRQPAHYRGKITGNTMTLKVTLRDKDTPIGDFQLELGKNVRLHKCM